MAEGFNTAENGERWEEVCEDHWHCDPAVAGHNCCADRLSPCPTCGAEPTEEEEE